MNEDSLGPYAKWEALEIRCVKTFKEHGIPLPPAASSARVKTAVADREWQYHRVLMLGQPEDVKHRLCLEYLSRTHDELNRAIRIYNYIGALRRGGLVKDVPRLEGI